MDARTGCSGRKRRIRDRYGRRTADAIYTWRDSAGHHHAGNCSARGDNASRNKSANPAWNGYSRGNAAGNYARDDCAKCHSEHDSHPEFDDAGHDAQHDYTKPEYRLQHDGGIGGGLS
jgi:hypothetical protein